VLYSASDVAHRLSQLDLDREQAAYVALHSKRYAYLLNGLIEFASPRGGSGEGLRILDIGPGMQTTLLRETFPHAIVNTVGYPNRLAQPRDGERHFDYDLTSSSDPTTWPELPLHDVVVFAEVIEHLATSPLSLLQCIAGWMAPRGVLAIQTPNVLALSGRIRTVLGRNPLGDVSQLTSGTHNPGHFREYTLDELATVGRAAGLEPLRGRIENYFVHPGRAGRLYDWISAIAPRGMRHGITIYLRKPESR
jgi:hypothetical protein